jgi:hypothetical protein
MSGLQELTLRDYFAANVSVTRGELSDFARTQDAITNSPRPEDLTEAIAWDVAIEAQFRYLKADAMIAARTEDEAE